MSTDSTWDVQLGVYSSLSEALDALAYRWGDFSDEFKRALMRIRASVLEPTEAARYAMPKSRIIYTGLFGSVSNRHALDWPDRL